MGFWILFLLGVGLIIWSIGVTTAAGVFFGGVAALLLRPYFKRLETNHAFDFLVDTHPNWTLLLFLVTLLTIGFLLTWRFGEQFTMGVFVGACCAIMLRYCFVRSPPPN